MGKPPAGFEEIADEQAAEWLAGDHWAPAARPALTATNEVKLKALFKDMGLGGAVLPQAGAYDHLVILGGTMPANLARAQFAKDLPGHGANLKPEGLVTFLGGQRPRGPRDELALDVLGVTEQTKLATEAELARLALEQAFGPLDWRYSRLHLGPQPKVGNVPYRGVAYRRYTRPGSNQLFNVLNAAAVDRPQGQPRHTSASSVREWLANFRPATAARVALISNNPHVLRVGAEAQAAFARLGRPDIIVESCGPGAPADAPAELFLGELARILHNAAAQA